MSESIANGDFEINVSEEDIADLMEELSAEQVHEFDDAVLVNDEPDVENERTPGKLINLNFGDLVLISKPRLYKLIIRNKSKNDVNLQIRINSKNQRVLKPGKKRTISVPVPPSKEVAQCAIRHSGKPTKERGQVKYEFVT